MIEVIQNILNADFLKNYHMTIRFRTHDGKFLDTNNDVEQDFSVSALLTFWAG